MPPFAMRHAVLLALIAPAVGVAACSSSGGGLSLSNFNTSCSAASDCVAVAVDPTGCCDCPSGAINKSDLAKYQAALAAQGPHQTCNVACVACPVATPVCTKGTCDVTFPPAPDGGPVACGTMTCQPGELCVQSQFEGGAVMLPNDAGMCPAGEMNENGICQHLPTYACAATPPACASSLSCACAQSLCQSSYTCTSASQGLVQCLLAAP
jgi:hypothetical protein